MRIQVYYLSGVTPRKMSIVFDWVCLEILACWLNPGFSMEDLFQRIFQNFLLILGLLLWKLTPGFMAVVLSLLRVSFGARRSNYKSVFHWEKATGEVQPLSSSTWITLFREKRKETMFTMTWISPLHTGKVQHKVCSRSWPVSEEFLS